MATNDSTTSQSDSEFNYRFPVSRFTTGKYLDQYSRRVNYEADPPRHCITEREKKEISKVQGNLDGEFTTMVLGVSSIGSILAIAADNETAGIQLDTLHRLGWLLDHMGDQMLDHLNNLSTTWDILNGCEIIPETSHTGGKTN